MNRKVFPTLTQAQLQNFDMGTYGTLLEACKGSHENFKKPFEQAQALTAMLQRQMSSETKVEPPSSPAKDSAVGAVVGGDFPTLPSDSFAKLALDTAETLLTLMQAKEIDAHLDTTHSQQNLLFDKVVNMLSGQLASGAATIDYLLTLAQHRQPQSDAFSSLWETVVACLQTRVAVEDSLW